jgi:hypothetical protein
VREVVRTATVGVIRGMKRQEYSVPLKVAEPQRELDTASLRQPKS